jgi:hypothetical protein
MIQMYVLNNKRIASLTLFIKFDLKLPCVFRWKDNSVKCYEDNWQREEFEDTKWVIRIRKS